MNQHHTHDPSGDSSDDSSKEQPTFERKQTWRMRWTIIIVFISILTACLAFIMIAKIPLFITVVVLILHTLRSIILRSFNQESDNETQDEQKSSDAPPSLLRQLHSLLQHLL
jgi:flagellar basal body-associated protein FliL